MLNHEVMAFQVEGLESDVAVLTDLYERLAALGIVKESFKEAILTREANFATGLQVGEIGFAIPHTDSEHVNESQIAIMTLAEPVMFKQMGDHSTLVPVSVVFMLALKESAAHLTMLQTLIELMQNDEVIRELLSFEESSENKAALKDLLKKYNIV